MAPGFLLASKEGYLDSGVWAFQNHRSVFQLVQPYGWGRNFTGHLLTGLIQMYILLRSLPLFHMHTHTKAYLHIANSLLSKQEAREGCLFLASSLRRPPGAGNSLPSPSPIHPSLPSH